MFLGSFLKYNMSLDPTPVPYHASVEKITIENGVFSDLYIDSNLTRDPFADIEEWDHTTVLHATFDGNLLAGNIKFPIESISKLLVKKRVDGDLQFTKILEIDINGDKEKLNFYYNDILVASKTNYEYAIVPVVNGVEKANPQTISVYVEFDGAFIMDTTKGYHIIANLSKNNLSRNVYGSTLEPINSKYPYINYYSELDYDKFAITGMFVDYDPQTCTFDFENGWKVRKEARQFLNNKRTKIVKLYNGEIYMAAVVDQITEAADGHPDNVNTTVNFVEVGNVYNNSDLYYHGFTNYLEVGV